MKNALLEAAFEAGAYIKKHFKKKVEVDKKGSIDLVTSVDRKSEKIIKEVLHRHFPDVPFVGEESFSGEIPTGEHFLVDPLDGTTNFIIGLPYYAVSIAYMVNGEPRAGAIYLPEFDDMYYAEENEGAFKNDQRINVSSTRAIEDATVATGFPYDVWENFDDVLSALKGVLTHARAVRRLGSAAVDLCLTAEGVFDAFYEHRLKPWDTAAGVIIVREAGGRVTDFSGRHFFVNYPEIVASNGKIHDSLLEVING